MGFDVINKLAKAYNMQLNKEKFDGIYDTAIIEGEKAILVKPQTYMNLSGICVKQFVDFYKISPENIIIIYDDIDIPTGIMKIRKKGGAGTHNGMKSVVHELNTTEFPHIRIGTGKEGKIDNLIEYVINKIDDNEYSKLEVGIDKAVEAVKEILKEGIDLAMNKLNAN